MDYNKIIADGTPYDLIEMFPSAIGRLFQSKREHIQRRAPRDQWRRHLYAQDGTLRIDQEDYHIGHETEKFVHSLSGSVKYRKGRARVADGHPEEVVIAFHDTKKNRQTYENGYAFGGFPTLAYLCQRMTGRCDVIEKYTYTPPEKTIRTASYTEVRFIPSKVMYVGVKTSFRPGDDGGATLYTEMLCSPTKSDETPTAMPVSSWNTRPTACDYKGDPTTSAPHSHWHFKVVSKGGDMERIQGVKITTYKTTDGKMCSLKQYGGYDADNRPILQQFLDECPTMLVASKINTDFINGEPETSSMPQVFVPAITLRDMTEREGDRPFNISILDAERTRRGDFKDELVGYVFHPDRMLRLHGESFVDVMADCY